MTFFLLAEIYGRKLVNNSSCFGSYLTKGNPAGQSYLTNDFTSEIIAEINKVIRLNIVHSQGVRKTLQLLITDSSTSCP